MSEQNDEINAVPIMIVTLERTEEDHSRITFHLSPITKIFDDGFIGDFALALESYAAQLKAGGASIHDIMN